ncbi:MAG: type II secretion system protein [Planctomycetota bacterium]
MSYRDRSRGFTLIELLVVVAMIILLIGLTLPAVGRAIGSARNVACLSNLRQQGIGINSYLFGEQVYPITLPYRPGNTTWKRQTMGGKSDHPSLYSTGYFTQWIPETERPLNPYLYDDIQSRPFSYTDPYEMDPDARAERELFLDPGERVVPTGTTTTVDGAPTLYESFGSSYAMNTWTHRAVETPWPGGRDFIAELSDRGGFSADLDGDWPVISAVFSEYYRAATRQMSRWPQAEFVLQMDYLFNFSFFGDRRLIPSQHPVSSLYQHNVVFADGHSKGVELTQNILDAYDYEPEGSGRIRIPAGPGWSMTDYRYDRAAIQEFLNDSGQ